MSALSAFAGPSFKRISFVLAAVAVLAFPAIAADVAVPDAALETALRIALGNPSGPLQDTALASLSSLNATAKGISDVTGIEACTSLSTLILRENQITDITPLTNLLNLEVVDLAFNQISDVTPLDSKSDLTHLDLSFNQLSDISTLGSVGTLEEVRLDGNQIQDISPVGSSDGIVYLSAHDNQIQDISGLGGLFDITTLILYNNSINDLSPLSGHAVLTNLDLSSNAIISIAPLSTVSALTELKLSNNQISDLTPLQGLPDLTTLYLSGNNIADLTPLAAVTTLMDLRITGNQVSELGPLSGLTDLQVLVAGNNPLSDLSPLTGLTTLQSLTFFNDQITDISPLATLPNLAFISFNNNQITDITALANLLNISTLDLANNRICDISPLVNSPARWAGDTIQLANNWLDVTACEQLAVLANQPGITIDTGTACASGGLAQCPVVVDVPDTALEAQLRLALGQPSGDIYDISLQAVTTLNAPSAGITDLTGIEACTGLTSLNLAGNAIVDISPLAGLPLLATVSLGGNPVGDLAPLASLPNLTTLNLDQSGLTDLSGLAGATALTALDLSGNQIVDITPLQGMTDLVFLSLSNNQVESIDALAGMRSLATLLLHNNQLVDITPLAGMTSLSQVDLSVNSICILDALASTSLTSGGSLDVSGNPLSQSSCGLIGSVLGPAAVTSGTACLSGGLPLCPGVRVHVAPGGSGNGTASDPFGSIQLGIDFAGLIITAEQAVTVEVDAGSYEETLVFSPGVRLAGAGKGQTNIVPRVDQLSGESPVVVLGADGASMEGVSVKLPQGSPLATILKIDDDAMQVLDTALDGNGSEASVAVVVEGTSSTDTIIKDCAIEEIGAAVEARDSGASFAFNTIDDIKGEAAVHVVSETGLTPALGDLQDLVNTGSNQFTNIDGKFLVLEGAGEVKAEANYWDNLPVEGAIKELIDGEADVSSPLFTLNFSKVLPSASLFVTVTDNATNQPLANAQVTLVSNVVSLSEGNGGVYVAPLLPLGVYTVRARKTEYQEQVQLLSAAAGINNMLFALGAVPSDNGGGVPLIHKGDTNGSTRFELNEILRVVQLYNSGNGYSCSGGGEDGYQLGPAGGHVCPPHSADYAGGAADWRLTLSEVLRVIQLYNTGGYYRCNGNTEDGYCPKDW